MDPASDTNSYPMSSDSYVIGFYELERSELVVINLPRGSKGKKLALDLHEKLLRKKAHDIVTLGIPGGFLEVVEVITDENNRLTRQVLVYQNVGPSILFANTSGYNPTWPTHIPLYGPFLSLEKIDIDLLYQAWHSLNTEELQGLEQLTSMSLHTPAALFVQAGAQYAAKLAGSESCFDRFPEALQELIWDVWESYKD